MAKIVIAGKADCPYYAKTELLADTLQMNLPLFHIHKIVLHPLEWESWLAATCGEQGWEHSGSPLVWRELVDRGGKGLYLGGANEFQEYAQMYYGVLYDASSRLVKDMAVENLATKAELDEELRQMCLTNNPIHVCITNASHPMCYSMVQRFAAGYVLGPQTQVSLRFLTSEDQMAQMAGLQMEAFDLALPLLTETKVTTDIKDAIQDCSLIIFLDELPQGEEEPKVEYLRRNQELFQQYCPSLNSCSRDMKIVVAGNGPVNFNARVLIKNTEIPARNIIAMSRTLENQAKAVLAQRLKVNSACVVDVAVWGDPTGPHLVDVANARVHEYDGAIWGPPSFSQSVVEMAYDNKWLAIDFPHQVEERRRTEEQHLGHVPAFSQGAALVSLVSHWWHGSPVGQFFSLGVLTDGTCYDVPADLVFSLPVRFTAGQWHIVNNVPLNDETKAKIKELSQAIQGELASVNEDQKEILQSDAQQKPDNMEAPPAGDQKISDDQNTETAVAGESPQEEAPPSVPETPPSDVTQDTSDPVTVSSTAQLDATE